MKRKISGVLIVFCAVLLLSVSGAWAGGRGGHGHSGGNFHARPGHSYQNGPGYHNGWARPYPQGHAFGHHRPYYHHPRHPKVVVIAPAPRHHYHRPLAGGFLFSAAMQQPGVAFGVRVGNGW